MAVTLGVAAFVVASPAANAAVAVSVVSTFPSNVTVGQTGVPASLHIQNVSTPPDNIFPFTVTSITLVPSCGAAAPADCPPGSEEPGVFAVSATGAGETGTACAGNPFTITASNPTTGRVTFTPATQVVLGAAATCGIDFTVSVLRTPFIDSNPGAPGLQTIQIAAAGGTTASGSGTSVVTVQAAQPTLVTTVSGPITVGAVISDSAVLAAGVSPTGTITFTAFGPADATCTGAPAFTATVPVAGNGTYDSGDFTPTAPGTYRFVATYSGNANNAPVTSACGAAGESVVVLPAPEIAAIVVSSPQSLVAPGGTFTFTVRVSNPSTTEPVQITSLADDVYGDLASRPGSNCATLIGVILAPGTTSDPCTYTGTFTGSAGDSQDDTVTVTGGPVVVATATATATVTITAAPPSPSPSPPTPTPSSPAPSRSGSGGLATTGWDAVDPLVASLLLLLAGAAALLVGRRRRGARITVLPGGRDFLGMSESGSSRRLSGRCRRTQAHATSGF